MVVVPGKTLKRLVSFMLVRYDEEREKGELDLHVNYFRVSMVSKHHQTDWGVFFEHPERVMES